MNIFTITFSPTGGTARAAAILAQGLGEGTYIDLVDRNKDHHITFGPEDVCLLAVPSYGGRVPALAVERIKQLCGGGARAVLVAVYGNRAIDDTLLELRDLVLERNFRPVAAVSAVAEHSILRQFGTNRPDKEDEIQLLGFAQQIRAKLERGEDTLVNVPGDPGYVNRKGAFMVPSAGVSRCIRCGLCARKCPAGAIPAAEPSKTDEQRCISCMRCVALCPQGARKVEPKVLVAVGEKLAPLCSGRKGNSLWL